MDFPEDFNQLELLNTHGHLIPRGASSLWSGSKGEEEEFEEEESLHSEEWYLEKEKTLKDKPKELLLWAAENNRVSDVLFCYGISLFTHAAAPNNKTLIYLGRIDAAEKENFDQTLLKHSETILFVRLTLETG